MLRRAIRCVIESLESRLFMHAGEGFHAHVNFQPVSAPVLAGYAPDTGGVYGDRGNGLAYGWNVDNAVNTRDRDAGNSPDQAYDTLNHMQKGGGSVWEIAVPNGQYSVRVVAGDAGYFDSTYRINAEGVLVVNGTPNNSTRWIEGTQTVTVSDGRLTITSASGAVNNKINFIELGAVEAPPPPPPPDPDQTPFLGTPFQLPTTIQAEDFDNGGEGVAYHDVNASNRGGAYRSTGVDIRAAATGHVVGWTSPGEWYEYTLNVPEAGSYLLEVSVAAAYNAGTFHVEFDGVDKTGPIQIPNTGGWNSFAIVSRTVTLAAGQQVMRVAYDSGPSEGAGDFDFVRLTSTTPQPNQNPSVNITSPTTNSTHDAGTNLVINASASDVDGTVAKVEFHHGTTKIGQDTTGPFSFTWNNVPQGSYVLTAVATDDDGATTTSSPINITVNPVQPPPGQTPFLGSPFQIPTTIQAEDFDNGGQGVAYHDVNTQNRGGAYRGTAVDIRAAGTGHVVGWTSPGEWLEYTINVPEAGSYLLEAIVAAGYTAGKFHVEFDGVDKTGSIQIPHTGGWNTWQTLSRTVNLAAGQQVMRIAYETGPSDGAGDIDFVRLTSTTPQPNQNPSVNITAPTNNSTHNAGANLVINANASDVDGTVSKVEFYHGTTKLGEDLSGPFSFTWNNVPQGSYVLTAVATDDDGATTSSSPINITVNPLQPPPGQTPFLGPPFQLPTTIQVEDFDNGGEGVAYHDTASNNLGGGYRNTGVDIKAGGSGHFVGWTSQGEWLEYTVNVPTAGNYLLEINYAAGADTGWVHVEFNGVNKTGSMQLKNSGGWTTFKTLAKTINLSAGQQVVRVFFDQAYPDAGGNLDYLRFTPVVNNTFTWDPIASMINARAESTKAVVNGKMYVFGGFGDNNFVQFTNAEVYDPVANTWTAIANLPKAVNHTGVASDGDIIYIAGGFLAPTNGTATNEVWKYNTATNTWSSGIALPSARAAGSLVRVGRELHYIGGSNSFHGADLTDHYVFNLDTGTQWTNSTPIPSLRNHTGAAVIGTKIYVIGGQRLADETNQNQAIVEVFDVANPGAGWVRLADMPSGRGHISESTFVRNGRIVVVGGSLNGGNGGVPTNQVIEYDPAANVWLQLTPIPQARKSAIADSINGKMIVAGGYSGVMEKSAWSATAVNTWETAASVPTQLGEVAGGVIGNRMYLVGEGNSSTFAYNLSTNTWGTQTPAGQAIPNRPFVGDHHAAEVIGSKLYLLGGLGGGSEGKLQIYDTATNSWSQGAVMPFAAGSISTAVIGGQIYAAGGIVGSNTTNLVARYNPTTNIWTPLANMPRGVNHAASATDGSKLYVFGGRDGANVPSNGFNDVQIFDPGTGAWTTSANTNLAPLPQARGGMGKAVYFNGEFYVLGGETSTGAGATPQNVYNRVDVYNPSTNTWRLMSNMPTARHGIFPLLVGGRIYVAAGGTQAAFSRSSILEILNLE